MPQQIRTRLTEMFGIDHPVVQGGMMWVSKPGLVAAVANAGALGFLTALTFGSAEGLAEAIDETRRLTDRPFGVNLTFLPTLIPVDYGPYIDVIVDKGIPAVETAGRNPAEHIGTIKAAGAKVIHKCTSVRHAVKAQEIGCDVVSIDGFECAGHPGEDDVTSLILIPRAVDELNIPVIASGGFADGRGLAAALAMGAVGVNMGTRFLVTQEAEIHEAVKQRLIAADETDTLLVMRTINNTERVLANEWARRVVEMESRGATLEELAPLLSGKNGFRAIMEGDTDGGLIATGQVTGLVHDVPSVAELVDRVVAQAAEIMSAKLPPMLRR